MITVINDRYYDESYNSLYEGMSLPEAAAQMVLECSQAINDLQMDTLLMEHSYLIENGEEIEYVTENDFLDGIKDRASNAYDSAKAHGSVLINKIGMLIDKVATMIRELWEKAVDFVQEKITEFRRKLFTMGHSEKEYKELISGAKTTVRVSGIRGVVKGVDIVNGVKDLFTSKIEGAHYTSEDVYNRFIKDSGFTLESVAYYNLYSVLTEDSKAKRQKIDSIITEYKKKGQYITNAQARKILAEKESGGSGNSSDNHNMSQEDIAKSYLDFEDSRTPESQVYIPKDVLEWLGKLVYSPNVFIKQIRTAQKNCDTILKKMKAEYGKTGIDASELADIYKGINERLKSNANVARGAIKAVNTSTLSAMKIVAAVFKDLRKDKRERDKKAAKDKADATLKELSGKNESYYYTGSNSIYSAYTL